MLRLVGPAVSADTVEALRELLERAVAGEVIGIAFAALHKGKLFLTETTGECGRNPVFTLGMVKILEQAVIDRMRPEA